MQYLVKLVRDKISDNNLANGVQYRRIEDRGIYLQKLREKLMEEATEYLLAPSLSELGDIYEVISVLAEISHGALTGHGGDLVAQTATRKREKRGGFRERIGLYVEEKESYV